MFFLVLLIAVLHRTRYKWIIVTYHEHINDCLIRSCLLPCEQLVNRDDELLLQCTVWPGEPSRKMAGHGLLSGCGSMPPITPLYITPLPNPLINPPYTLRSVTTSPQLSSSSSKPGETSRVLSKKRKEQRINGAQTFCGVNFEIRTNMDVFPTRAIVWTTSFLRLQQARVLVSLYSASCSNFLSFFVFLTHFFVVLTFFVGMCSRTRYASI